MKTEPLNSTSPRERSERPNRISELESIAEECEQEADGNGNVPPLLRASLMDAANYFRSKANTQRKVYRVEEETK